MLHAVSLFSGIGGLDLAASAAGFNIVAQVEIDPFCRQVLEFHRDEFWCNAVVFSDVRGFRRGNVRGYRIDLAFGGFPCQPFSQAGKRKGADDNQNLWREFRRVISELRPAAVLLENVPAICQSYTVDRITPSSGTNRFTRIQKRRITRPAYALRVIADLSILGYECRWGIISAADAGGAHLRKRWWLVGYAAGTGLQVPIQSTGRTYTAQNQTGLDNRPERSGQNVGNTSGTGLPQSSAADGGERAWLRREVESGSEVRSQRWIPQPGLVVTADGLPDWLAQYTRPALLNELSDSGQFDWEPSRTLPQKDPQHKDKIKAVGNAVFIPTAYPLFKGIYQTLSEKAQDSNP